MRRPGGCGPPRPGWLLSQIPRAGGGGAGRGGAQRRDTEGKAAERKRREQSYGADGAHRSPANGLEAGACSSSHQPASLGRHVLARRMVTVQAPIAQVTEAQHRPSLTRARHGRAQKGYEPADVAASETRRPRAVTKRLLCRQKGRPGRHETDVRPWVAVMRSEAADHRARRRSPTTWTEPAAPHAAPKHVLDRTAPHHGPSPEQGHMGGAGRKRIFLEVMRHEDEGWYAGSAARSDNRARPRSRAPRSSPAVGSSISSSSG